MCISHIRMHYSRKLVLCILIPLCLLLTGCSQSPTNKTKIPDQPKQPVDLPIKTSIPAKNSQVEAGSDQQTTSSNPSIDIDQIGDLSEYFPYPTGMKWTYKVETGNFPALAYQEEIIKVGEDNYIGYATRKIIYTSLNASGDTFSLRYKVKGRATEQGIFQYSTGVEIEIEEDTLGIYEDAEQVFWATLNSDGPMVNEIVTYPPDTSMSISTENSTTLRVIFFTSGPGIQIGIGTSEVDQILFADIISEIPGLGTSYCPCLHFVRTVKAAETDPGSEAQMLDKEFSEDTWFAKGKGLVRLVQTVEGTQSMVWTLVEAP